MPDVWLVREGHSGNVLGIFDDLVFAKHAVEELHRESVWRDRELEWDDTTYGNQVYAYPVFPDDWDRERIATIYRVRVNKNYNTVAFGEKIEDSNA